jgi:ATP-dependent DNA helicase RecG
MDDDELEGLLRKLESDLVERKASLSDPDRIREAICAYANDFPDHRMPGVIFIGANDDGSCSGLEITDELLLKLSNMRDDGAIQPFPSMTVEKRELNGCQMAVLIVKPYRAPPIRFKGVTWIRVGPRRSRATPEDELILAERRQSKDLPFDLQPLTSAMIEDLDLDLFEREYLPLAVDPSVLEQDHLTIENKLRALRFLSLDGHPTVLGVLVLGKDSLRYIPGAYIQFLRFEGDSLTDPIRDRKEIDGPLPELLRRLDDVLEAHNTVSTSITSGPIEVHRPEYPMSALQQLARNAILHRTYKGTNAPVRIYWFSDRVEIHSPGGPYGQVTKENFGRPGVSDYRNPHLAEAMKVLGYVQRFGLGIQIARDQLAKNGNPDPEFIVETTNVLVTIRRHS